MDREQLKLIIVEECEARAEHSLRLRSDNNPDPRENSLMLAVEQWSNDPVMWMHDCGYSPDPRNLFGGKDIPPNLTHSGMVPLMMHPRQEDFVRELHKVITEDPEFYRERGLIHAGQRLDYNLWKSRQQALTTMMTLLGLHLWLFYSNCQALWLSYDEDAVDSGGQDDRTADSLFGRGRMQLDAFFWLYPELRFNQHIRERAKEAATMTGMLTSEDKRFKLTRPPWFVGAGKNKVELFPLAKNNTIMGAIPQDKAGKSRSYTYAFFDEFGEYPMREQRRSYSSISPCCQHNITAGTIPEGGGLGSMFHTLSGTKDKPGLISWFFSWTHNLVYMHEAYFRCSGCEQKVPLHVDTGFEYDEIRYLQCPRCGEKTAITHREVHSPWFDSQVDMLSKVEIERYYWGGFAGAQTNIAFPNFSRSEAAVERTKTPGWETHIGYDPGHHEDSPAVVVIMRYEPAEMRLRYIAHIAVVGWQTQKLVPFFKCWPPNWLGREKIVYGSPEDVGKSFSKFDYSPDDKEILARIAEFVHTDKKVQADIYGNKNAAGVGTAFKILKHYNVYPASRYEMEREVLIRRLQDVWVPRLEIEDTFINHRPRHANGEFPSFAEALETAQMITGEGHGEVKYDISGKVPNKQVKDVIDALMYLIRGLPAAAHGKADQMGDFSPEDDATPLIVETRGEVW